MQREMHRCLDAFNESDEKKFAECLDPKIVLFSMDAELYGREQAIGYFRDRYFRQKPAARLEIHESAFHPIAEAVWYDQFTMESARGVLRGHGHVQEDRRTMADGEHASQRARNRAPGGWEVGSRSFSGDVLEFCSC